MAEFIEIEAEQVASERGVAVSAQDLPSQILAGRTVEQLDRVGVEVPFDPQPLPVLPVDEGNETERSA